MVGLKSVSSVFSVVIAVGIAGNAQGSNFQPREYDHVYCSARCTNGNEIAGAGLTRADALMSAVLYRQISDCSLRDEISCRNIHEVAGDAELHQRCQSDPAQICTVRVWRTGATGYLNSFGSDFTATGTSYTAAEAEATRQCNALQVNPAFTGDRRYVCTTWAYLVQ